MSNFEEDNISRLKFIGKINKGEKINIKDMIVQPNNVYTKIHRSLVIVDNRNNTLSFILDTVKKSFEELLVHIEKSKENLFDLNIAINMMQDLENCKAGLSNLKDTYSDDLMFCCKIDTTIQDIEARLEEIKSKYSIIKNTKSNPVNIPQKNSIETTGQIDSLPSSLSSVESEHFLSNIIKNN